MRDTSTATARLPGGWSKGLQGPRACGLVLLGPGTLGKGHRLRSCKEALPLSMPVAATPAPRRAVTSRAEEVALTLTTTAHTCQQQSWLRARSLCPHTH